MPLTAQTPSQGFDAFLHMKIVMCFLIFFLSGEGLAQETRWNGFMDINGRYSVKEDASTFDLGQLDIYVTSDVTDRISFLTENTFTVNNDGTFRPAVERAIIKYEVNNYLNFLLGKHHTPVSYWNNKYHHGRVLQPTSTRPLLFDYSIFPFHTLGLIVSGDFIGKYNFGYQFMVGNGAGHNESVKDNDRHKSVSLTTHIHPVEDLKVAFSVYRDHLSKGLMNFQDTVLTTAVMQHLISASLAYFPIGKRFEGIVEWMYVNNSTPERNHANMGFYVYSGYNIKKITPYLRYDYIDTDYNDPFFKRDKMTAATVGVRYSFSYNSNIKFEWMKTDSRVRGDNDSFLIQFGIGF